MATRYFIDPATGQTMAQMDDGSVVPVQGGSYGDVATGAGGPTPTQTPQVPGLAAGGNYQSGGRAYEATPFGGRAGLSGNTPVSRDAPAPSAQHAPSAPRGALTTGAGGIGGGGSAGGFSGGGGGGSSLYNAWRDKLMGAAYPNSSTSYPDYKTPKTTTPEEEKLHGPFAKGMDVTQAGSLGYRPTAMIPTVFPHLGGDTPLYGQLSALPAYELGLLSNKKAGGDLSATVNSLGKVYQHAGMSGDLPDFGEMWGNFSSAKKGSGLDTLFRGTPTKKGEDSYYDYELGKEPLSMSSAADTTQSLLDAMLQTTMPTSTAEAYSAYGNYLIDQGSAKALKHKPGVGKTLPTFVGRRLFR